MAEQETMKTREITIETREKKELPTGKTVWNITDADGVRYSVWDEALTKDMQEGIACKVKYAETKNGKFTNRTIRAVAYPAADGESYGAFVEAASKGGSGFTAKKSYGKTPAEQDAIITQTCLKAATELVAKMILPSDTPTAVAHKVITIARTFKTELFAAKPSSGTLSADTAEEKEAVPA